MDLFASADQRPVHFMGIGGAGMSALALLARRRGVNVTGCDTDLSGATDLIANGIPVASGHDAAHVAQARAVVVTAAVPPTHPELAAARALGVPVVPRKEALGALCLGRETVALAGTHGKTTTTVMTTEALAAAGLEPTGLAGGRVGTWGGNARVGADRVFVVEADEYDKAFLALQPTVAVVNNVEADHLECYGTVAQLEDAFAEFASRAAVAIIGADDLGARRIADRLEGVRVVTFGTSTDAHVRLAQVEQAPGRSSARVHVGGRDRHLVLRVPGLHNLRNATAALLAAHELGADLDAALDALARFTGVGRRFEHVGTAHGIEIVDDYAHHPTEVAATLEAARQAYPGRRLVAVFQPHLFSRTQQHGDALGAALAHADVAVVTEIYAAREQPVPGVSGRSVADAAERRHTRTLFVPDKAELPAALQSLVLEGDVVFTLGAGDITRVGPALLARLEAR